MFFRISYSSREVGREGTFGFFASSIECPFGKTFYDFFDFTHRITVLFVSIHTLSTEVQGHQSTAKPAHVPYPAICSSAPFEFRRRVSNKRR